MNSKKCESIGLHVARYGLVLVLIWIGAMKFTAYEAEGIKPMVENSPLMSWMYNVVSVRTFSTVLGSVEIIIALMIAARPMLRRLSAAGSALAIGMFLTTLSFLITTPGWHPEMGFPALTVSPGQFILKDIVLLGVAILTAGEAWGASQTATESDSSI